MSSWWSWVKHFRPCRNAILISSICYFHASYDDLLDIAHQFIVVKFLLVLFLWKPLCWIHLCIDCTFSIRKVWLLQYNYSFVIKMFMEKNIVVCGLHYPVFSFLWHPYWLVWRVALDASWHIFIRKSKFDLPLLMGSIKPGERTPREELRWCAHWCCFHWGRECALLMQMKEICCTFWRLLSHDWIVYGTVIIIVFFVIYCIVQGLYLPNYTDSHFLLSDVFVISQFFCTGWSFKLYIVLFSLYNLGDNLITKCFTYYSMHFISVLIALFCGSCSEFFLFIFILPY